MYRVSAPDEKSRYHLAELARMFFPTGGCEVFARDAIEADEAPAGYQAGEDNPANFLFIEDSISKEDSAKILYEFLNEKTGRELDWGTLTGVRPVKLYNGLRRKGEDAFKIMKERYLVSDEKALLLHEVSEVQKSLAFDENPEAIAVYIGIPFCPTRCNYCSFTSSEIDKRKVEKYLPALFEEMKAVSALMKDKGLFAESIYIGGGTPSSLDEDDFAELLANTREFFLEDRCREFTVEAGRPETLSAEKLAAMAECGAKRMSINPQSMKQRSLELIGRIHSPQQIIDAFALARSGGDFCVNMDLIAGLPEEEPEDFEHSLDTVIGLGPENITVHTLAIKRASRLIEEDRYLAARQADNVRIMLQSASRLLREAGYRPYYLYRQKNMAGNFENIGWSLPGYESLYNVRIMEENQIVAAMGAGAISKMYFPQEDRIERIPNVSDTKLYIERIDEMIKRKEDGIL